LIPLFELSHQTEGLVGEIERVWSEILASGNFVSGVHVERFEQAFADAHEIRHAIAVATGTAALEISLRALGAGPGDEVIVPTNSFIASAECVSNVGATPVFVDINPETANVDLDAVNNALGAHTVGVIGVHLYGSPFDTSSLRSICDQRGLFLVEDAAQAHLAEIRGKPVGGIGDVATFSFYPGKNLGAPGEGGMITTNDDALVQRLRALRNHGQSERNVSWLIGSNGRMPELAAAVLELKLPRLSSWNARRREVAALYKELLDECHDVVLLEQPDWATPVYHVFSVEVPNRDQTRDAMAISAIETGLHYPIPIHLQDAYRHLGYKAGELPVAERRARCLMSLPMYPGLQVPEVERVARALVESVRSMR
jgi:dTDP-4-amino-4,6-dideoxygalactose transaminase